MQHTAMAELRSICVYCGSNAGARPDYAGAAEALGRAIAESGTRLVYGGGAVGLMGIVARATMAAGGPVTGIIPKFLKDRELMLREVSDIIVTADMHERKKLMFDRSDAFVALPGGIGTLEEVVEMMTWAQLDQHVKPVLILNLNGFYDPLVALFRRMSEEGFLNKAFAGGRNPLPVTFVDTVTDVIPTIRAELARTPQMKLEASDGARLM
jgi:uncharacterized protein (TIGR00730 family)